MTDSLILTPSSIGPIARAGERGTSRVRLSFEFFPPKTEAMEESLWAAIRRLEPLAPDFVSVTYGAGGSTRERTHSTIARILKETALLPAAHLTCVEASRDEVDEVIRDYWNAGIRHIVALRGDPPGEVAEVGAEPASHGDAEPGLATREDTLKSYELFARYVMPQFQGHAQATLDAARRAKEVRESLAAAQAQAVEDARARYGAEVAKRQA